MKSMKKSTPATASSKKVATATTIEFPHDVRLNKSQVLRVVSLVDPKDKKATSQAKVHIDVVTASAFMLAEVRAGRAPETEIVTKESLTAALQGAIKDLRKVANIEIIKQEPTVVAAPKAAPVAAAPKKPVPPTPENHGDIKKLGSKVARQGGVVLGKDGKPLDKKGIKAAAKAAAKKATVTSKDVEAAKVAIKAVATTPDVKKTTPKATPAAKTEATVAAKPYAKYGMHGHNVEHADFSKGDPIGFDLQGERHVGEFVHVHVNNHSPNGYAVIRYNGKIYERTLNKIFTVAEGDVEVEHGVAEAPKTTTKKSGTPKSDKKTVKAAAAAGVTTAKKSSKKTATK